MSKETEDMFVRMQSETVFRRQWLNALKIETHALSISSDETLRILDFGAGLIPHKYPEFIGFHSRTQVVAFEPNLEEALCMKIGKDSHTAIWTKTEPTEDFHMVMYNFSLHHLNNFPVNIFRELNKHKPKILIIADYDYLGEHASLDEFVETFSCQGELRELATVFSGDIKSCYQYHNHIGSFDCHYGLQQSGFMPSQIIRGNGLARFKYCMFGVKSQLFE